MRVLVTGGAGYIGSLLTSTLLAGGHDVTVVDKLLFGGDPLLPFLGHPRFAFHRRDVVTDDLGPLLPGVDAVYHLAAIVGFPACQAIGEEAAFRVNHEAATRLFDQADRAGVRRFIFASSYSNYGIATDGAPVTEDSPLAPQSLYARTKIAAERHLLERAATSTCAPVIPRFTTLFGVSPRTRFDLLVNQFVFEALTQRKLVLFKGNYMRSFVHVRDVVRALVLFLEAADGDVRGQVFNVGSETANHSKRELVELVAAAVDGVRIEESDVSFSEDMRDVAVSAEKIRRRLGFRTTLGVRDGIAEVRDAIVSGLIHDPGADRYRNHRLVVR